jgi:phosphatidylglycerol lysyltransferase
VSEGAEYQQAGSQGTRWLVRMVEPRVLGPLAGAALVLLSAFVIHAVSGEIHLDDIRAAIAATPWMTIFSAVGFTLVSYAAMSLYDVLAVRQVASGRVSDRFAAFTGAIGYAVSNTIGFSVLVGGSVRYRLYGSAGLDAADIGRVVGISFLTFWLGLVTLLGIAFVVDPVGVPLLDQLSANADRAFGAAILIALAGFIVWLSTGSRRVSLLGWSVVLPGGPSALLQIAIGAIDIAAAAGALYVLLPAGVAPSFAVFLVIFVAAIIAGLISHAPGGLGVLEATVLLGLGAGDRPDVIAALVVFRIVYYLLPLAIAGIAFLAFEAYQVRQSVLAVSGRTLAATRLVVAPVAATLVFVGGIVLLLSGNLPAEHGRVHVLMDILPLPFAEASHMLASLVGLLLIIIARGLYRRIAFARTAAIALLVAGALFSLAKGLDWEEASVLIVIAALLAFYKNVFYRKGDWRSFRPNPAWLALVAITLICLTLVGFLAFRHVEYSSDLWWEFAWRGDAPRFLRASLVLGVLTAVIALDVLINRPVQTRIGRVAIPEAVRTVVAASETTDANLALLGDKRFLLSDDGRAFLMYGVAGRTWIAMGDPVGASEQARTLAWRFAECADKAGARVAFYEIGPQMLPTYLDFGFAILKIGEVANVDLSTFTLDGAARQDFRYAAKRAEREGLVFQVVPKADVPSILPQLKSVSDAWLAIKAGSEKGFSLGRFDEPYLSEFDCAVIRKDGEIVAFANLWQGANRHELSVDLMRYRPGVSKVLMDALFARLLMWGKAEGYAWFSLGAAPLSGLSDHPLASTWNRLGTFIYRRGDEIYNFEGLRAFKEKFGPVWTPQYIACPGGLVMPQVLLDVASLISGGSIRMLKR